MGGSVPSLKEGSRLLMQLILLVQDLKISQAHAAPPQVDAAIRSKFVISPQRLVGQQFISCVAPGSSDVHARPSDMTPIHHQSSAFIYLCSSGGRWWGSALPWQPFTSDASIDRSWKWMQTAHSNSVRSKLVSSWWVWDSVVFLFFFVFSFLFSCLMTNIYTEQGWANILSQWLQWPLKFVGWARPVSDGWKMFVWTNLNYI